MAPAVHDVADAGRPGDQLALVEDRDRGVEVGRVDAAVVRVVVLEDVAVLDAGVLLVVQLDVASG